MYCGTAPKPCYEVAFCSTQMDSQTLFSVASYLQNKTCYLLRHKIVKIQTDSRQIDKSIDRWTDGTNR